MSKKPKIYIFIQQWYPGSNDVVPAALAEDGHFLTGHLCSHEGYVAHDMGIVSDWKHDVYDKHYPDGWELEYVPREQVRARTHHGLEAAYAAHLKLAETEKNETATEVTDGRAGTPKQVATEQEG